LLTRFCILIAITSSNAFLPTFSYSLKEYIQSQKLVSEGINSYKSSLLSQRLKTHKVAICGRVHALGASDDHDHHHVAEDSDDEDDALEKGADGPVPVRVVLRLGPQTLLAPAEVAEIGGVAFCVVGAAAQRRQVLHVHRGGGTETE